MLVVIIKWKTILVIKPAPILMNIHTLWQYNFECVRWMITIQNHAVSNLLNKLTYDKQRLLTPKSLVFSFITLNLHYTHNLCFLCLCEKCYEKYYLRTWPMRRTSGCYRRKIQWINDTCYEPLKPFSLSHYHYQLMTTSRDWYFQVGRYHLVFFLKKMQ